MTSVLVEKPAAQLLNKCTCDIEKNGKLERTDEQIKLALIKLVIANLLFCKGLHLSQMTWITTESNYV